MATAANPYAGLLGRRDALEVLAETPRRVSDLAAQLGTAGLELSYAPGKWNGRTILSHLADCEIAFGYRWRQVVAEEHHVIQPFDQDLWARHYAALEAKAALEVFCGLRQWSIAWLKALPREAFSKAVTHPERGELTLHMLLELTAGHDLNHLRQLDSIAAKAGSTL
jgi:hypothetical protein